MTDMRRIVHDYAAATEPQLRVEAERRATVVASLDTGEQAMTLPGHHSGALAVITHAERPPQMLMPDGSRRDLLATDQIIRGPWR